MAADESDWLKLPTDEKCQHKAWKARLAGYQEAIKLFQTQTDEKSPEFSKYLGLVKKFVVDSNAVAQEKGLEATLVFVESYLHAGRAAGEVSNGVISKCLSAPKAKTRELGASILMALIEAEKQEIVQEELMKGLTNKQPKIVSGCVIVLREALRDFGTKIISVKPLVKQLQTLLEDRDKVVRDETKLLAVEIFHWIGPALKPQLTNLKPVQLTELESEFEKLPPGKPQQTRFLRSQQDLKAKMAEKAAAGEEDVPADGADGGDASAPADIDPYDLMDPVDILSKLPKDFYEKVEEKKWQDRKEALEAVQKLAESPKLENGDYNDLVRALKKVVSKDTNVMLVTIAAKIIALLAAGLRKKFSPHAPGCIEALLEKFREKKVTVVQALREAVDACYGCINLDPINEIILAALEHKTPSVKAETAAFLARAFSTSTQATLPKKLLKLFITALLKTINDTTPEVREASFDAIGTAMKVISEKAILPFLGDVDPIKMAKIKECADKAVIGGKAAGSAAEPKPAAAAAAAAAPAAKASAGPPKSSLGSALGKKPAAGVSASGSSAAAKKAPAGSAPSKGGKKKATEQKEEQLERDLSDEQVEEKMQELFPGTTLPGLADANWKERLASCEKLLQTVKTIARDDIPTQAFVRTIIKKPGLKENNFQVLKLKIDLLTHLAQNSSFTKRSAMYCLTDLMDKISDAKNGSYVQEALTAIAECTSLDYVAQQVIIGAFDQKNPKNQSESLNWFATALKEFGFKVTVKPIVEALGKALAATNPAVRTSGITVLGVMYMYMGPALRVLFENEKPALLQQIDAEFEKVKDEKPPAPIRGVKAGESGGGGDEEDEEGGEAESGEGASVTVADLIPRNDISSKITDALLAELDDKNWKVRKEGLEKLTAILNEAKFITSNIGSLPEALKRRLGDSNKILVSTTLTIIQTIANSMGPSFKQYVQPLAPGVISNLGDSKPAVRQLAVAALNAMVEHAGLISMMENDMFAEALKAENPTLRAELLGWLSEKLGTVKKAPPEFGECMPHLFACLEDRNADVRKKASEALMPFTILLGYDGMLRHAGRLKPTSKDVVIKQLEAIKPNLPQKAPPPAKAAAATAAKPAAAGASKAAAAKPAAVAASYDDDDEDVKPDAGAKGKGLKAGSGGGAAAAKKGTAAVATKKKGQEEEDTSPPLKVSNGKEQRFKDEKTMKVLKWNFTAPRPEFVDQLKQQMEATFNRTLIDQLFHNDFKYHIKALDMLTKVCEGGSDSTVANLDLILKWLTLRFFDTNTTVLMKELEYLQLVFSVLADEEYHLHEYEAVSFIPYLVNKVGDPKDNIRKGVRTILQLICRVYAPVKMFNYVIAGLTSKNAKQRTECLDELGCLIGQYGINVCQPTPGAALKQVAQQISDRDNSVRSAALNTIVIAYGLLGENVYKYVGTLNDKDQVMLDERIKRSAKTRPPPGPLLPPNVPASGKMSPEEKPKANTARVAPTSNTGLPKPGEMMRAPAAAPPVRRTVGQFQLEYDDGDAMVESYSMPQLLEPDLRDILDDYKVPEAVKRAASPSAKLLQNVVIDDARVMVDLIISQIASKDTDVCVQALQQIDVVLKDSEKCEALVSHVDQLLIACTLQLRCACTRHTELDTGIHPDVTRLYKCLLATILSWCQCDKLAEEATRDVLKDLIYTLITILLDSRLAEVEEGQHVSRSVNVTIVRIVEKADSTNALSALIKLLHSTVAIETCSPYFLDLVMKCVWRMVRMLPNIVDKLNLDRIVFDTHQFLKAFPSHTWKERGNEMPLRTMKTLLHSLAKLKGNKILNHLSLIESSEHSEVDAYLRRMLRGNTSDSSSDVSSNSSTNGQLKSSKSDADRKSPKRISKSVHESMTAIFKKIGSKELTKEGLNDLYDFKEKYPDADLQPFLSKSSQFFQEYIERGLINIRNERESAGVNTAASSAAIRKPVSDLFDSSIAVTAGSDVAGSAGGDVTDNSAAEYMDRLKQLRARCGFTSKAEPNSSSTSSLESIQNTLTQGPAELVDKPPVKTDAFQHSAPAEEGDIGDSGIEMTSSANMDDIKKRLERIKQGIKN